jgi:hypothetical protein
MEMIEGWRGRGALDARVRSLFETFAICSLDPFLAVQALVLFMNVPGRKFCSIPAARAIKYVVQMVTNGVL